MSGATENMKRILAMKLLFTFFMIMNEYYTYGYYFIWLDHYEIVINLSLGLTMRQNEW